MHALLKFETTTLKNNLKLNNVDLSSETTTTTEKQYGLS